MNMTYREILPGVSLRVIESSRFETSCLSVSFLTRADEDTASHMTLVPRVLRRGTVRHPDMEALAAALDDLYGARIEPISRKHGDIVSGGFICDFVDTEEKTLPQLAKLLFEIMFETRSEDGAFFDDFVSSERSNLIDEIKSEINNKLSYAHKRAEESMFKSSAFSVSELGSEDSAEKVTGTSLYKFYKKMINELPCEVFFCGAYSYDEVEREILKLFRLLKRGKVSKVSSGTPAYSEELRITEKMEISQANLLIGMYTESEDIFLYKLLSAILGGGTTSKLFENVREKKSLCYFAGAMFDSFKKNMFLYCGIDPKNAGIAEEAVLNEFRACLCGNITDDEIADAKKGMIDDLLTVEDSLGSMEAFWLRAALMQNEKTPLEIASDIKKYDTAALVSAAGDLRLSITYLLTGEEGVQNERKLLS